MSTALDMESGLVSHGHDVMAVTSDTMPPLSPPPWRGETGVSPDQNTGLMVTKLLTRPKTSSAVPRASMHYVCGSKRAIQVLGEKLSQPNTPPQPQPQERPKTSVIQRREKERPATSSKDRSGFVVVPGKELPLPICTTRNTKSPGADKDILSITTRLRNRSAIGARSVASLIGPTARDKSAALLKELSLSFSLKDGPTSPFKDCLRERWQSFNKDDPLLGSTVPELPLSSMMPVPGQDASEEVLSPDDCSRSGCKTASSTERSRRTTTLIDINENLTICSASPTKDSGDLTRRSASSVKDSRSKHSQRGAVKRVRSSGNVLTYFSANNSDNNNNMSRKDAALKSDKDVVMKSPRIITINRLPSPTTMKESRTKPREKQEYGTKPKSTLTLPGAAQQQNSDNLPSLQSVETLVESPLQGEAPCQVTSFDMAISTVKETFPSPRTRAASFLSERTMGQPVSVTDDTVLKMCSLYDQHPSSFLHNETKDADGLTLTQEASASVSADRNHGRSEKHKISHEDDTSFHEGKTQDHGDRTGPLENDNRILTRDNSGTLHQDDSCIPSKTTTQFSQEDTDQPRTGDIEAAHGERNNVSKPIFISPRNAEDTEVNGETVKVLSADLDRQTIHVPVRSDSSESYSSSSTPTVPLSSSDLLYGGGGGGGDGGGTARGQSGGHGGGEEVGDSLGAWDHRSPYDKQKLKELDLHGNKRPPSRNSVNNRKVPNFDKVSFDRDREELRPLGNSLGPAKQSPLRANGIKNNLLRPDQFLSQRTNGRDDDLVAMGTIWSPSQLQTRGSSTNTTSSGKSTSAPTIGSGGSGGNGGGAGYTSSSGTTSGTLPGRRPVNMSTSTSTRQLLHHHHQSGIGTGSGGFGSGAGGGGAGNGVRVVKEAEPKYSDPLSGASPTFQQRLMELAALEAETVRWERTKKIKKKPKQDRDS